MQAIIFTANLLCDVFQTSVVFQACVILLSNSDESEKLAHSLVVRGLVHMRNGIGVLP